MVYGILVEYSPAIMFGTAGQGFLRLKDRLMRGAPVPGTPHPRTRVPLQVIPGGRRERQAVTREPLPKAVCYWQLSPPRGHSRVRSRPERYWQLTGLGR